MAFSNGERQPLIRSPELVPSRRGGRHGSTMQGKVAVISGGSTGVGRAVGAQLAENGAEVVLLARRADRLEAAAREMTGSVLTIPTDVSSGDSVRAAFAQVEERFGRVDIL